MIELRRMWVNQPSTLQPDHAEHGKNVLVVMVDGEMAERSGKAGEIVNVWHVAGPAISELVFVSSLSPDWRHPAATADSGPEAKLAAARDVWGLLQNLDGDGLVLTDYEPVRRGVGAHFGVEPVAVADIYTEEGDDQAGVTVDSEEFEASVKRCEAELAERDGASYAGREIDNTGIGFTYNGSEFYGTLRECMRAADKDVTVDLSAEWREHDGKHAQNLGD